MNLLRRLFHRLKMHNFNSRPADLSWIYVSRSIPMTLRYSGPKKVQSSSTARMQTHYTILFYSTPLSFCTISPLAHALCLKSFPVSHTKWMRIGLLLVLLSCYLDYKGSCLFFSQCPLTDGSCWAALRDSHSACKAHPWLLYLEGATCGQSFP